MDNDFYSSLYTWFDKCGIISDVRTHLRHSLFQVLKTKDMTFDKTKVFSPSANQYFYDLLIADYLWNHDYDYTLSVFASEVPILVNHNHKPIISYKKNTQKTSAKRKLQSDYICYTLEALGIQPNETVGKSIITDYANNDVSLLLSILKYHSQSNQPDTAVVSKKVPCDCEKKNSTSIDLSKKNVMVDEMMEKLLIQKNVFDKQLTKKKSQLKNYSCTVGQQMVAINDKLSKMQILIDEVNLKKKKFYQDKQKEEQRIHVKQLELSMKESTLYQEAKKLEIKWNNYTKLETNLKELKDELKRVKKKDQLENSSHIKTIETSIQTDECFFNNENINYSSYKETLELQMLIKEQQLRIEKLTLKAVSLSEKIETHFSQNTANVIFSPITHTECLSKNIYENSSTDDIIQDAKKRLKRLKEETFKADQGYFNSIVSLPLL
ncbi:hypothetical protein HCN44_000378 [Aphidius gifuensis]|uniref:LisH domain-containing protein n=1 Tax=Aphidius gifuensis TaxID=684658 RepID=A0A835CQU6_APHGI|nr:uncharacterized protein LOC122855074 [Aphidius gifuensis]KAF7990573.1 hypothetical protein HCN44_000378 [Aphidius gifuensis]